MTNYELWLTSDTGLRLANLSTILRLEASRAANKIAYFSLLVPLSFNPDLIQPDRMLQVWRQPSQGKLGLWRVYFLRRWKFSTQESAHVVELGGPDTLDLLRRRIVAAYAASSQADKSDYADDMMKEVVSQSVLDGALPTPTAGTRAWANLSIAPDLGLGPSISKAFSFDKLLASSGEGVIPALSKAAKEAGTEVFFDIVPDVVTPSSITFRFETYIGQPGQDVSSRITFDEASGNVRDASLEYDHTEEENYIYSGGQGEAATRNIQQVYDAARYTQSIWGRMEGFADAKDQTTDNGVREVGRQKLNEGRPRVRFGATLVDTQGTKFGLDWDFGYKVGAKYLNRQFNSIVRAATISISPEGESVQARMDYEGTI